MAQLLPPRKKWLVQLWIRYFDVYVSYVKRALVSIWNGCECAMEFFRNKSMRVFMSCFYDCMMMSSDCHCSIPSPYGLIVPKIGDSQPSPKTLIVIISGTGINYELCRHIHRIDQKKSPLKISGKVTVDIARDSRKFFRMPICRVHRAVIFATARYFCFFFFLSFICIAHTIIDTQL